VFTSLKLRWIALPKERFRNIFSCCDEGYSSTQSQLKNSTENITCPRTVLKQSPFQQLGKKGLKKFEVMLSNVVADCFTD
jgi:hypothetical protein